MTSSIIQMKTVDRLLKLAQIKVIFSEEKENVIDFTCEQLIKRAQPTNQIITIDQLLERAQTNINFSIKEMVGFPSSQLLIVYVHQIIISI